MKHYMVSYVEQDGRGASYTSAVVDGSIDKFIELRLQEKRYFCITHIHEISSDTAAKFQELMREY